MTDFRTLSYTSTSSEIIMASPYTLGNYSEYRPLLRYFTDVIIIVKIVEYTHHLVVPAQLKSRVRVRG